MLGPPAGHTFAPTPDLLPFPGLFFYFWKLLEVPLCFSWAPWSRYQPTMCPPLLVCLLRPIFIEFGVRSGEIKVEIYTQHGVGALQIKHSLNLSG